MPIVADYDLDSSVMPSPSKNYLNSDNPNNTGQSGSDLDSNSEPKSNSEEKSKSELKSMVERAITDIGEKTKDYLNVNEALVNKLKRIENKVNIMDSADLKTKQGVDFFTLYLDIHLKTLTEYYHNRAVYLNSVSPFLSEESQMILDGMENKLAALRVEFIEKIETLKATKKDDVLVREMFNATNVYRKEVSRYLNVGENYFHAQFRASSIFKSLELKKSINSDFAQAKKDFSDKDLLLKKKTSERLYAKKT
jgi:hypothetical protein